MSVNYSFENTIVLHAQTVTWPQDFERLPFYPLALGEYLCGQGYYTQRNNLPQCLLLYTLEGSGLLRYHGKEVFIPKNCAALIDCRYDQYYAPAPGCQWHFYWLHFAGTSAFEFAAVLNEGSLRLAEMSENRFSLYYSQLHALYDSTEKGREFRFSSCIHHLLTELALSSPNEKEAKKYAIHKNKINAVISFIQEHHAQPLTVDMLAAQCHLSKFYFIKIFRFFTGNTPHEFLTLCRIDCAKKLLSESTMSIGEIATAAGFSDAKNFIASFKKHTRVTPLYYRNRPHI